MTNPTIKKILKYGGAVLCSLAIILIVPVIIHPNVSGTSTTSNTATVVSISTGNENTMNPKETCTIVFRTDGQLVPITETPEYCAGVKVGDTVSIDK